MRKTFFSCDARSKLAKTSPFDMAITPANKSKPVCLRRLIREMLGLWPWHAGIKQIQGQLQYIKISSLQQLETLHIEEVHARMCVNCPYFWYLVLLMFMVRNILFQECSYKISIYSYITLNPIWKKKCLLFLHQCIDLSLSPWFYCTGTYIAWRPNY